MSSLTFTFASMKEGQEILVQRDDYLRVMRPFERSLKMQANTYVPESAFGAFLKASVMPWTQEEMEKLKKGSSDLIKRLDQLEIDFHENILLVKTDGREEWNSAYTRANGIILPEKKLKNYGGEKLVRLLAHELFHIISRKRPALREQLYKMLGFTIISEISFPKLLESRILTNPDAPLYDNYIEVFVEGAKAQVVPIVLLKESYENINAKEDIFHSIAMKLAVLEEQQGEWKVQCREENPLILNLEDVSGLLEQVGEDMERFNQVEEILAENFALLVGGLKNVTTSQIFEKMRSFLTIQ
ncbi:hypothetical protein HNQ80_000436 [Anaerosolibacter carboniphilus]|uniref:Uncharacterized protein n=1 Tax=Anaerosolibacter carboniphilus TaxID=1417629 RepID=A0A841KLR3_9FIRM|nr:hypothetical protein [Anaerosolibacter carboniphilus]MBB6214356.1 hypothetical protein [Anaerosolibacter carboniphilus]